MRALACLVALVVLAPLTGARQAAARVSDVRVLAVSAPIGHDGTGAARCPTGAQVLGGGYVATATVAAGALPRPLRAIPGVDASGRDVFAVRLAVDGGGPWHGGGTVFATCLSRQASETTRVARRSAPIPKGGFAQATCPAGDEATGGGYSINYPIGGRAAPLAVTADPGTAEDGTSSYDVDVFAPAGAGFNGGGTVTVRCLPNPSPAGQVLTVSTEFASGAQRATVACPAGSKVVGGGFISAYLQGTPNRPVAVETRPLSSSNSYAVTLIGEDRRPLPPGGFVVGRCLG